MGEERWESVVEYVYHMYGISNTDLIHIESRQDLEIESARFNKSF